MSEKNGTPEIILPDALYTLTELRRRSGLGKHALRMARRNGLVVRRLGRRSYVIGSDLIEYVRQSGRMIG